jgi:hypothetical protein
MSEQLKNIFAPAEYETESVLWHTPTLAEVVATLYPQYERWAVDKPVQWISPHQGANIHPRPGFVWVILHHPAEFKKVAIEVHENCFRSDGPPPHPENMITPAEAEREIFGETYTVLPSGRSIVCQLTLACDHTEEGIAHVIDGENFNLKKGREAARRKAMDGVYRYLAQRKREFVGKRLHTQD